jgi:hypothetical protein
MQPQNNKATVASDAEIDSALARARSEQSNKGPLAASVKYVPAHDIFVVALSDGSRLVLQREKLQGLQNATRPQLRHVEVLGLGTGLHWEDLDVDLYVPALIEGVYGNKHWMAALGRQGGSVKSDAKRQAARLNGAKGGRPKNSTKIARLPAAKKVR